MNCQICGNKMKKYGKLQNLEIFKCKNCGVGETIGGTLQSGDYHRDEVYIGEEELFKNIFSKRSKIISKLLKPGKVLEVGCSTGIFLNLLKDKGWEVTGIEISTKASDIAKKKGIRIINQKFEKIEVSEKFDLIIFNHTLEHLENPIETLKKAKKLLLPKGYLYIDLPNFGGVSAKLLKIRWPLLLPEEHLWHFSEASLKLLLENLDFKIVYVNKSSGIWDYGNLYKGLANSLVTLKKRFLKEFLTAVPSLIVSLKGWGSDLMIIARKK